MNRLRALFSHGAVALGQAGLVALVVVALVAGTALAAKGGGGNKPSGGGTLAVAMVSDQNANGLPNWADRITFSVSASADKPWVNLKCYQGSAWVYTATVGFFPAYPWAQTFTLSSSMWTGGAGSCTATLYAVSNNGRQNTLATLGFEVGG